MDTNSEPEVNKELKAVLDSLSVSELTGESIIDEHIHAGMVENLDDMLNKLAARRIIAANARRSQPNYR